MTGPTTPKCHQCGRTVQRPGSWTWLMHQFCGRYCFTKHQRSLVR